jgi:hypothetical protein
MSEEMEALKTWREEHADEEVEEGLDLSGLHAAIEEPTALANSSLRGLVREKTEDEMESTKEMSRYPIDPKCQLTRIVGIMLKTTDDEWTDKAMLFIGGAVEHTFAVALCENADGTAQCWRNMALRAMDPVHMLELPSDWKEEWHHE